MSAAATSEASCALVDINLGETSGLDLARQLSVADFKFPLIFMTGVDDDTIRAQCMDFGCVAFLRKPFHEGQLAEAVAKAVGIKLRQV
jgi:FixJ family two-component response regulator